MYKVTGNDNVIPLPDIPQSSTHLFGPPNEEALAGHPLNEKGLKPFGAYEILNSSWLNELEKMNSVHPYHVKSEFMKGKRHIVLTFHDSTFECIADSYTFNTSIGSVGSMVASMGERLR